MENVEFRLGKLFSNDGKFKDVAKEYAVKGGYDQV